MLLLLDLHESSYQIISRIKSCCINTDNDSMGQACRRSQLASSASLSHWVIVCVNAAWFNSWYDLITWFVQIQQQQHSIQVKTIEMFRCWRDMLDEHLQLLDFIPTLFVNVASFIAPQKTSNINIKCRIYKLAINAPRVDESEVMRILLKGSNF